MNEVYQTILQTGAIGGVLVWTLWANQKLVHKLITVCEETVKVLTALTEKIGNLERKIP